MITYLTNVPPNRKTAAGACNGLQWIARMYLNHSSSPESQSRVAGSNFTARMLILASVLAITLTGCSETSNTAVTTPAASSDGQTSAPGSRPSRVLRAVTVEDDGASVTATPVHSAATQGSPVGSAGHATQLQIGDQAPELIVKTWVHETPAAQSSAGSSSSVQVVTFWATWCEPSVAALERLESLQTRFGSKVQCLAVSSESPETVTGFLNSVQQSSQKPWREILSLAIAADHRGTAEVDFLLAGSEQGLPTSIVIDQNGIIAWSGTPDRLEPVLAKVVAGQWDSQQARIEHQRTFERSLAQRLVRDQLALAKASNDPETCVQLIDRLLQQYPGDDEFELLRLQFLLRANRVTEANSLALSLLTDLNDDTQRLNQLAWMLCESGYRPELNLEIAQAAAEQAVQLTQETDASSLETLARVCFRRGEVDAAMAAQSKAIQIAPGDTSLQETLNAFRQASSNSVQKAGFRESGSDKG